MAKNTNMIVVSGNIVRDVELNESQTLIRFCIANSESVKKDGKWEEYTNYFDIKGFGGTVKLAPYLVKGTKVIVTGSLHQDRWEKDGQKNSRIVINCSSLEFGGNGKKKAESQDEGAPAGSSGSGEFKEDLPWDENEDIPF